MEGLRLHSPHAHLVKPLAHLTCRTGGEGDSEDSLGIDKSLVHHVGNAVGNRAGFTRSCACQDAHWAARRRSSGALVLIEQGQIRSHHRGTTP